MPRTTRGPDHFFMLCCDSKEHYNIKQNETNILLIFFLLLNLLLSILTAVSAKSSVRELESKSGLYNCVCNC